LRGFTPIDLRDRSRLIDIRGRRLSSRYGPGQVQRLRTHFAGKRRYVGQGRSTPTRSRPPLVRPLVPLMSLKPREAAMWDVMKVADIPPIPGGCACCGMRFERSQHDRTQRHYFDCQQHYPQDGEAPERELARLRHHDQVLGKGYAAAWHFQRKYHEKMTAALETRDKWKAALAQVLLTHEPAPDGSCTVCHEATFPCSTWGSWAR
jgi:hypothetical protein